MKIRTQLAVGFLLLAIVPLMSIVLFSYFTSIRAVEQAVEAEGHQLTVEMDQRMTATKEKLARGVARLRHLPLGAFLRDPEGSALSDQVFVGQLMSEIGDAFPFLESLTLVPEAPEMPFLTALPGVPNAPRPPIPERPIPRPPSVAAAAEHREEPLLTGEPESAEIRSLRIDMPLLREAYHESLAEQGRVIEESELEVEMAELGHQAAAAALGELERTMTELGEHLKPDGDEPPERVDEKAGEMEREALRFRSHVERLTKRIARIEHGRAIAAIRAEERRQLAKKRRQAERLLGQGFGVEIRDQGALVGRIHADISPELLVRQVLGATPQKNGEIPFALDVDGQLYPAEDADRAFLESLELVRDPTGERAIAGRPRVDWMVISTVDPESCFLFGIARPIGDSLAEIHRTTARNLALGLGLVVLSLFAVLPLSGRITRGLETVTEGAEKIARGDLSTRVPVPSRNEVGQLALAFNQMAEDLADHQSRLLKEEGLRKEQALEKRFLEAEFLRKSRELDEARQFQLSLLPKNLPRHPSLEIACEMQTAAEVGGDYYDFHQSDQGILTLAIGDATGHGARAGTMVTVIKSLFSANFAEVGLSKFLRQASKTVRRMDLGRMTMALSVVRIEEDHFAISAAGMPPALLYRADSGEVEELALPGMPLGGLLSDYEERRFAFRSGDTLLLLSDGLPELPDRQGEPLGYAVVRNLFTTVARKSPAQIVEELADCAARRCNGEPPADDMTLVVVKKG